MNKYKVYEKFTKITTVIILAFLYGCASASYVLNPNSNPKDNLPVDYKIIGVVKYLNQGADFVVNSRRDDAFKKMFDSCGGKYKIINEGEKADNSSVVRPVGNAIVVSGSNYWYITYECLK